MSATIALYEETLSATPKQARRAVGTFRVVGDVITAAELIRRSVSEALGNSSAAGVEAAARQAIDGFRAGRFFMFFNDRQVTDLAETLLLGESDELRFVRLVPLRGG